MLLAVIAAGAEFVERGAFNGVTVSQRAVPGSAFLELRFVATARSPLEALCQRAFDPRDAANDPYLVSREVLHEDEDDRTTYERIAPPLVSRRDFVLHSWRKRSAQRCQIGFASIDDAPERDGWVRLERLAGSFAFEQQPDGTVRVEHRIHMDPGGLLTPLLVESSRLEMGLAFMRRLLGR